MGAEGLYYEGDGPLKGTHLKPGPYFLIEDIGDEVGMESWRVKKHIQLSFFGGVDPYDLNLSERVVVPVEKTIDMISGDKRQNDVIAEELRVHWLKMLDEVEDHYINLFINNPKLFDYIIKQDAHVAKLDNASHYECEDL